MKNVRISTRVYLLCLLVIGVHAMATNIPEKYTTTYFPAVDGIVNDVIQDHKGLLWFATWNGLYRFDGYSFKNYKSNMDDKEGLTNDRLLFIDEDSYGCIWVLCYDSKVYRFIPAKEIFEPLPDGLSNGIRMVKVLPDGVVWLIKNDGGAVRICTNPQDLSLTLKCYSDETGNFNSIFCDSTGREWALTDNGLYYTKDDELCSVVRGEAIHSATEQGGWVLFGSDDGRVYRYSYPDESLDTVRLNTAASVVAVQVMAQAVIYVTDRDGLFVEDVKGDAPKHYTTGHLRLSDSAIKSAELAGDGLLWLVHPIPGVSMFDIRTREFKYFVGRDEFNRPLSTETGFFAIEDCNGNLWVHPKGGGFSYFDTQSRELVPFNTTGQPVKWKSNDRCYSAFADKQGNLWMSTQSNRLERITLMSDKFLLHTPARHDVDLPDNEIRALFVDSKRRIWTGSRDQNISVYDSVLNLLHRFEVGRVYAITQGSNNVFWISTKGDGIIKVVEKPRGGFELNRYKNKPSDPFSVSNNSAYYTFQDSRGRLWFATYGGGVNIIEDPHDDPVRFINHNNLLKNYPIERCYKVRHITEDRGGTIWISTTAGILYVDNPQQSPENMVFHSIHREQGNIYSLSNNDVQMVKCMDNGKIYAVTYGGGLNEIIKDDDGSYYCETFTQKDGLISDIVYSVQEDRNGELWLATGGGLVKFTSSCELVHYQGEHMGFNVHMSEGIGATNGDYIYFGTNRGVFYFNPERVNKTDFVPQIFFNSVWVNNEEISQKTSPILPTILNDCEHVILPPENHSLRILFSALDMTSTEYIHYAYKLEGFDDVYRLADNSREANYTSLPPGKYMFHVKSTNSEGVWVDNERVLSIEVLPTFAETVYAKIIYVFLILILIVAVIYIYTVFYRMKQKVKNEELVSQMELNFFTNVSHELRTPLTLISGPLEFILKDENLPDSLAKTLGVVKKNSDRMQRLVGQILDFSKIKSNKMRLKVQNMDIVSFASDIVSYFKIIANEKNINMIFTSEVASCSLWFDVDKIEKVLFNILSNAFKYTSDNKEMCVHIAENEDSVIIQVRDEGLGIPAEKQSSIFNRFDNYVQDNLHAAMSSGIGLSVAKELTELHHGSIYVESSVGRGSTFSIRLLKGKGHYPQDTEYITADPQEEVLESELIVKERMPEGYGIDRDMQLMLIVEDNRELSAFIKQVFQDKFRFVEACNGNEGIDKAIASLPDIIITDIMMPEKDGIQMLRELRDDERTSHIPAIVLTAKSNMDSILTGVQTGADDYIVKPFNVNYLQAKVDNILAQRKKLRAYYHNDKSDNDVQEDDSSQLSDKDAAFLSSLAEIMEQQIDNTDLTVEDVVSRFSLSRTNFFNKLKSLTGLSPIMYIKEVRMRRAAELIKKQQYSMSEIAYMVGYSDPHYFSKSFKSFWGVTCTEYAKAQTKS